MKILHIVHDWWLSESAINLFAALPVENEFVFFNPCSGSEYKFKVLKSVRYVKIIDINSREYDALLEPARFDLLWAHGLYLDTAKVVEKLDHNVKVMWTSYGFDYLRCGVQWMYGPKTACLWIRSVSVKVVVKTVLLWLMCKLGLLHFILGKCLRQKWFRFFDRVDYFSAVVPTEEKFIRKVLGSRAMRLDFHCMSYSAKAREYPIVDLTSNKMLVGHQADITVNHLDILSLIPIGEWEIYSPLSYSIEGIGETEYAKKVIEYGEQKFGKRFHPLVEFMPYQEYLSLIASCSVFVFNNYRQQGLGNVTMALKCGGCVFMSPYNPVYQYFKSQGVIIYPISRIKDGIRNVVEEFRPFQMENVRKVTDLRNVNRLLREIETTINFLRREIGA